MRIYLKNCFKRFKFSARRKKILIKLIQYIIKREKITGNKLFRDFIKNIKTSNLKINFLFVDDDQMKKYNYQYFKKKSFTDVISFSMLEGDKIYGEEILGDAIISIETAMRNAKNYNNTVEEEVFLYVIHAILHMMGYDHPSENSIMRKKEKFYFDFLKTKLLK